MSRVISRSWLMLLLSAMVGLGTAAGQEDDGLEGDVPQWLENFGYEHVQEDGPVSEGTTQAHEGDSGSVALRAEQCSGAACDCFLCRDKLTGDWCGYRSCLQQRGIAYRGRVTQFFFGVGGGVNPPVASSFAALGIAGGDTFEYTGNSQHDFRVSLDKFGGPPHGKFVVTLENVWGRWGNVSQETGSSIPAVFNALMPVDHAHSQCRQHRIPRPALIPDFHRWSGRVPSGSRAFSTDHSETAEGDDDVATVSVRQLPCQS